MLLKKKKKGKEFGKVRQGGKGEAGVRIWDVGGGVLRRDLGDILGRPPWGGWTGMGEGRRGTKQDTDG